jgi:hypothetical protein
MKKMMVLASALGALALAGCGGNGYVPPVATGPSDVEVYGVRDELTKYFEAISGQEIDRLMEHYSPDYLNDGRTLKNERGDWEAQFAKAGWSIRFAEMSLRMSIDRSECAVVSGSVRFIENKGGALTEGWAPINIRLVKGLTDSGWALYGNQQPAKAAFAKHRSWTQLLGGAKAYVQDAN